MAKPKRWVLAVSGGLALVLVAGVFLALVGSTRSPGLEQQQAPPMRMYSVAEPAPPPSLADRGPAGIPMASIALPAAKVDFGDSLPAADPIAVTVPQIAYSYTLGYRLPASAIAGAQQAHLDLCNRLGPRCQLLGMHRASNDDGVAQATLRLRIASRIAQQVSADFTALVGKAGGRAVDTQVSAEDVSKDLVDTDARIRQREILVSRLTEMLRGRQGKVGELVEAERSVAQAQEELDQAKGWMGELKGRVAYSNFVIGYTPANAPVTAPTRQGFLGQLSDAIGQSGAAVAGFARTLLVALIFLAPWTLLAVLALFLLRPALRRWRSAGLAPVNEDA